MELRRIENMTVYVRRVVASRPAIPRLNGGRMPLSTDLAEAVLDQLDAVEAGRFAGPALRNLRPLLTLQRQWSALPGRHRLLAEMLRSREGWHLFLYPFAGRQAQLGLAHLVAYRLSQCQPLSFSIAINDYGFELLSNQPINWRAALSTKLFSDCCLHADVLASLNAGELSRRRFREIARIAGLVFNGYPGKLKSVRQLQASSELFYQVFQRFDPGNLLLTQAQTEVLSQELDIDRLRQTLLRLQAMPMALHTIPRPTPLAFPLIAERFRASLSSEKLSERIARLLGSLHQAADS